MRFRKIDLDKALPLGPIRFADSLALRVARASIGCHIGASRKRLPFTWA